MALVAVNDHVLDQLVQAAITDVAADEATPALTAGHTWTPTRITWLRDFPRDRRAGLDGPTGESTWAVTIEQRVVGSVRLQRTDRPDRLETGVWLTQSARRRGLGRAAMVAALREAAALGASSVRAETTASNTGALAVLDRLGFDRSPPDDQGSVHALRHFETGHSQSQDC